MLPLICRERSSKRSYGCPPIKYREKLAEHLIKKLTKRRMAASYAPTAAQAREEILAMIPAGAAVSRCGSMSLVEMGLWEALAQKPGVEIIDPFAPGLSPEESYALMRQGLLADYLITSSNALTMDGKLVNLDATGNRVAAMCFGPDKGHPGGRPEQGDSGSGEPPWPGSSNWPRPSTPSASTGKRPVPKPASAPTVEVPPGSATCGRLSRATALKIASTSNWWARIWDIETPWILPQAFPEGQFVKASE